VVNHAACRPLTEQFNNLIGSSWHKTKNVGVTSASGSQCCVQLRVNLADQFHRPLLHHLAVNRSSQTNYL